MWSLYTGGRSTETWPFALRSATFGTMIRKQRGRTETSKGAPTGTSPSRGAPSREAVGPCVICGMSDARGLVEVDLTGEPCVTLCGTHELMHRRSGFRAQNVAELRVAFGDRRSNDRRGGPGEIDELAESLTSAFTRERRTVSRRAS